MNTRSSQKQCPKCGLPLVLPSGPKTALIGVLGERPGDEEKRLGQPFVGESGRVLRAELARLNLSLDTMRVSNLWLHDPNANNGLGGEEADWHLRQALSTLKKCRVVLLLGSECAETFLEGKKVSNVTGLKLESDLLPSVWLIPAPNPASLLKRGSVIGEFRLALSIFAKEARRAQKEVSIKKSIASPKARRTQPAPASARRPRLYAGRRAARRGGGQSR